MVERVDAPTPCVIISGPPCTGKTTLGQRLAGDLALPFLGKDLIKEKLFDTLGWRDRDWSRQLGIATYELLYLWVEIELQAGRSFIVESNFDPDLATPHFLALKEQYPFEAFQVQCYAEGGVLLERFKQRAESVERHPGHVDHLNYEEMAPVLAKGRYESLNIGGEVLYLDTTDFERLDYPGLIDTIRSFLAGHVSTP